MEDIGYVYILSNPSMPGLVKIGQTISQSAEERAKNLSSPTGVPEPFKVEWDQRVSNPTEVEKVIHRELKKYRKGGKEFFDLSVETAKEVAVRQSEKYIVSDIQGQKKDKPELLIEGDNKRLAEFLRTKIEQYCNCEFTSAGTRKRLLLKPKPLKILAKNDLGLDNSEYTILGSVPHLP